MAMTKAQWDEWGQWLPDAYGRGHKRRVHQKFLESGIRAKLLYEAAVERRMAAADSVGKRVAALARRQDASDPG